MTSSRWAFTVVSVLALVTANTAQAVTVSSKFLIAGSPAFSVSAAFDGTNYLVGIQGDTVHHARVGAQLVSQSGALVGSLISTGRTGGVPVVAFDGANYLLVWTSDDTEPKNQVCGQFISPQGTLSGTPFLIGPFTGGQETGMLAFGGGNYLVVWGNPVGAPSGGPRPWTGLYGQIVSPSGALLGSAIPIDTDSEEESGAGIGGIAFDGTNFLAAWGSKRTGQEIWDISARFISPAGVATDRFVVNQTPLSSLLGAVDAFNGTNHLVIWGTAAGSLYGRIVSPTGGFVTPEFSIGTVGSLGAAFVAFDGRYFLLALTDVSNDTNHNWACDPGEGTCADIYGQFLSPAGALVGPRFPINTDPGTQIYSPVVFGGGKYLVVWRDGDVSADQTPGEVYGAFVSPLSACVGDCDGDGTVTVKEIITMVNIALGNVSTTDCLAGDANGDHQITVDEVLTAVNNALNGCLEAVVNLTGYWGLYLTYTGEPEVGPTWAKVTQSGSSLTTLSACPCPEDGNVTGIISGSTVSLFDSKTGTSLTGTATNDTMAGSFTGPNGPGTWRAVRGQQPTPSQCVQSPDRTFVSCRFGSQNGQYWLGAGVCDVAGVIASATISGSYIVGSAPLVKDPYSDRPPGRWWLQPTVPLSQGVAPPLPLSYVVHVTFKDATTTDVSRTVLSCEQAE